MSGTELLYHQLRSLVALHSARYRPNRHKKEHLTHSFIVEIYNSKEWNVLNKLPVSSDFEENIVSYFGDDFWDLSAYTNNQINETKTKFSFSNFANIILLYEQKLIAYSWLNFAGGRTLGYTLKASTLVSQQSKLNLRKIKYKKHT